MLVLTRKQKEKIRIGNEVTITVLRTKGKAVRLGIVAPAHINILRGELMCELPTEEFEHETAAAENAVEPAPRGAVKTSSHRQQPATNWPTSPVDRTDTTGPGGKRCPDSSRQGGPFTCSGL